VLETFFEGSLEQALAAHYDCLTQLFVQLACAMHWFNPLVWIAARRVEWRPSAGAQAGAGQWGRSNHKGRPNPGIKCEAIRKGCGALSPDAF
jgi:hypothetical protein